jgi:hypothetical protein
LNYKSTDKYLGAEHDALIKSSKPFIDASLKVPIQIFFMCLLQITLMKAIPVTQAEFKASLHFLCDTEDF